MSGNTTSRITGALAALAVLVICGAMGVVLILKYSKELGLTNYYY